MALNVLLVILTISVVILLYEVARLKTKVFKIMKSMSVGALIQLHESIDIKAIFQRLEKLEAQAKEQEESRKEESNVEN